MTPSQTKEFVTLCQHPAIKEKFDGWRVGDVIWDEYAEMPGIFTEYHCEPGDARKWMRIAWPGGLYSIIPESHLAQDHVWLPPVFSYTDSSRCLWAWVDWELFGLATHEDGLTTIYSPKSNFEYTGPFSIALAKAVNWKWEQEKGEKR